MRRPRSSFILPIVCFNLSLFLWNKEPVFRHWGEKHSPRNGSSTVICAMQRFATQHFWCRITVMIKASLISSEVCVCSPFCLPATGQDVSFALDSNDAGKTNHSSGASLPPGMFSPSSFNERTDGNMNYEWEIFPSLPIEERTSEGRSSFLSVLCPMKPLKWAQKIFRSIWKCVPMNWSMAYQHHTRLLFWLPTPSTKHSWFQRHDGDSLTHKHLPVSITYGSILILCWSDNVETPGEKASALCCWISQTHSL